MRKAKRIQISVPKPCTQSWGDMQPVHGGRHCASCAKTVTDFSGMTDRELFDFFKGGYTGCGRFHKDQLQRTITAPTVSRRPSWVLRIAASLAILLALNRKAMAQYRPVASLFTLPLHAHPNPDPDTSNDRYNCVIKVHGVIRDDFGRPVPNVQISIAGKAGTISDSAGSYTLRIAGESIRAWDIVRYQHPRYKDNSYQIFPDLIEEENLIVNMRMQHIVEDMETYIDGGATYTVRYSDDWGIEYADPSVAAEHRFADYKRNGTGFSPLVITLPSFKSLGRFFSQIFKVKKHADKNT